MRDVFRLTVRCITVVVKWFRQIDDVGIIMEFLHDFAAIRELALSTLTFPDAANNLAYLQRSLTSGGYISHYRQEAGRNHRPPGSFLVSVC